MSKWIPINKKVPELTHFMYDVYHFSDEVLVTVRSKYGAERIVIGSHDKNGWDLIMHPCDEKFLWEPIAWMPLPEPYKEENDDNSRDGK